MKKLIKKIEYNNGVFPRKILEEIINRKDEAIPELLEILKQVKNDPQKAIEQDGYFAHIYAVYLLAQFRVKELNPLLMELISLPEDTTFDLFGDMITEDLGRILASTYYGDIQTIKDLIENVDINEYVRGQGIAVLKILALHGRVQREEVIEYYRYLLNEGIKDNNPYVITSVIYNCNNLYPEEIYDDIKRAYEQDLVETFFIDLESIEETLEEDKEVVLQFYRNDMHNQLIDDTIDELAYWASFYKDREKDRKIRESELRKSIMHMQVNSETIVKPPKVGRNDPCPCGSGKKYKKCCGR